MSLNVQGFLKCLVWHLASLLWTEHKFNCGITGLRKAEKMSTIMVVTTTDENIEVVTKIILDSRWITIRKIADYVICKHQAIFTDVLNIKSAAAKIVPNWINFEQKQRRIDIAQEMLTTSTMIQISFKRP